VFVLISVCLTACGSSQRTSEKPAATPVDSNAPKPASADEAKRFVQRFYDWYVPAAAGRQAGDAALLARPEMEAALAPELLRVWRADRGLRVDPVTNAPHPCQRYEAVRGRQTGDSYWVDVRGADDCQHGDVDVTVQLTCSAPSMCSIFNFQYPGPPPFDLRSALTRNATDSSKE
jgi:hypothetical protein